MVSMVCLTGNGYYMDGAAMVRKPWLY